MLEIGITAIAILLFYFFWYFQLYGNLLLVLYGCSLLAVISVGIDMIRKKRFIIKEYPFGVWVKICMIPYCLITAILISQDTESAIHATITYTAFTMISFVIAYISVERKSITWLINILLFIVMFDCMWVLFRGVNYPGYGKVLGRNCNPNTLGVIMMLGLFSLAYRSGVDNKHAMIYLLISLVPLYVIIGCGSRKCFIAAVLLEALWVCFMMLHIIRNNNNVYILTCLCLLCVFAYIGFMYYQKVYSNAALSERMQELSDISGNSRIKLYNKAFELFFENPLFGVGIDQYQFRSGTGVMSHSTYAEMLADFGLIGSILYSLSFFNAISYVIKGIKHPNNKFVVGLVFALMGSELFLGIGQVFFFDIEHFVAWTIIYVVLHLYVSKGIVVNENITNNIIRTKAHCKYLRE